MGRRKTSDRLPFHDDIVGWRAEGKSLNEIHTLILERHTQDIHRNAIDRYCDAHDIPLGAKITNEPEPILGRLPDSEAPEDHPAGPQPEAPVLSQPTESPSSAPINDVGDAGECPQSLFPAPAAQVEEAVEEEEVEPATVRNEQTEPDEQTVKFSRLNAFRKEGLLSEQEFQAAVRRLTGKKAPSATTEDDREAKPPGSPDPEPPQRKPAQFEPVPEPWRSPPLPFAPLAKVPLWTPDLPVLSFGDGDEWTLRDACEGTFILGATGSGKTSGSGKTLAQSFLASGFGGLVLCVKDDERQNWERYAELTGRSEHLCVVSPGGPFRFNFLNYESQRAGVGIDWIENVANLFRTLLDIYTRGQKSFSADGFWVHSGNELLRNTLRIVAFSKSYLSLQDIFHVINEAPADMQVVETESWRSTPHFGPFMEKAQRKTKATRYEPEMEKASQYWLSGFPKLNEKTRSILVTSLSALIDGFYNSDIHDLFCRDTTLIPEATQEGAIILIDLPLKTRDFTGLLSQCIWKHFFQKAIERRREPRDACRRPVFLWADEAQFLYTDYDALFQSTARSAACATVYLTQNIANFYGIYGGNRDKINGFLGNLNTKIFHANNDQTSNHWAAEQIGKATQYKASVTSHEQQPPRSWRDILSSIYRPPSSSVSTSSHIDYAVQPSEFTRLRTGAAHNNCQVDAYFTKSGARFSTGKHYFKTTFLQEFE